MSGKKSPLTDKPLRQAGQSVNEKLQEIVYDTILSYYLVAAFVCLLAAMEWVKHYTGRPPTPWLYTIFAASVTTYAFFRIFRERKKIREYKQGRDGEKVVGEYLDRLRANGFRVYHDIPGDGWNIDHVIISTRGVFAIETKTHSKPDAGEPLAVFNGKSVALAGGYDDEDPIRQSLAQSKQLRTMLKEWTGRDFPVRGVVLYPGWYVQREPGSKSSNTWVLNPKALHKWIEKEEEVVPVDWVKQAATALAKYVRHADD